MGVYFKDASGKRIKVAGGGSGAAGPSGQDGKSAYDYAVAGGYTGTEAEFQALMGSGPWVPEAGYIPASNPNLLDNWYFLDPINQRGIQSGVTWGSKVYGLDRWKSFAADATKWVDNEGIYLLGIANAILEQSIETNWFGGQRQITFSALIGTTLLSFTQDYQTTGSFDASVGGAMYALAAYAPSGGLKMFRVYRPSLDGEAVPVIAAKVELGDKQTLARKDADGNWVLNDPPPNKALELAKCQRYQQVLNVNTYPSHSFGLGFSTASDQVRVIHHLPVCMTKTPAVIVDGAFQLNLNMSTPTSQRVNVSNLDLVGSDLQTIVLRAYGTVTLGSIYALVSNSTNPGRIILDANL